MGGGQTQHGFRQARQEDGTGGTTEQAWHCRDPTTAVQPGSAGRSGVGYMGGTGRGPLREPWLGMGPGGTTVESVGAGAARTPGFGPGSPPVPAASLQSHVGLGVSAEPRAGRRYQDTLFPGALPLSWPQQLPTYPQPWAPRPEHPGLSSILSPGLDFKRGLSPTSGGHR